MNEQERACEFEALVCETNAIGAELQGMKDINSQRIQDGYTLAYDEKEFNYVAAQYRHMAEKFRRLKDK